MTEEQWLRRTSPRKLLSFLARRASDRKLRLLACRCARCVWPLIRYEWARQALEAVEGHLEGAVSPAVAAQAREQFLAGFHQLNPHTRDTAVLVVSWAVLPLNPEEAHLGEADDRRRRRSVQAAQTAIQFAVEAAGEEADQVGWLEAVGPAGTCQEARRMKQALADSIHDLFGPLLFRPVALDPIWLTPQVRSLAHAAYEERELPQGTLDRARLAVLADALEEVSCRDQQILQHLRGPGPHVRGCWVIDLLLGKS